MTLLLLAAAAFPLYNIATGGTITTFTSGGLNYKRHTFTGAGTKTFTVLSNPRPFTLLVIGGGGSGGGGFIGAIGYSGGSGGGGGGYETTITLSVGDNSGTVGQGGSAAPYNGGFNNAGNTSFAGYIAGAGRGGQSGQSQQDSGVVVSPGSTGTPSPAANGGSNWGSFPGATLRNAYGLGTVGNFGNGGSQDGGFSQAGVAGAIVITYQIL